MKILVTGGVGFIGSHLVDVLVKRGYQVRVFDNFEKQVHGNKRPNYLNPNAEYIVGDVRNRLAITKAIEGQEAIFHFAAIVGVGQSMYQIAKYVEVNTFGTANLLDTLINEKNKVRKLIVASSMSVYGEGAYQCRRCGKVFPSVRTDAQFKVKELEIRCQKCGYKVKSIPVTENKPLMPTSIYAMTKKDQEEICLLIGRTYKIPTVALRFFNVYGPRQSLSNPYTGVCAIFSSQIKNNHTPLIFEDGLQTRDFISVHDVVQANIFAIETDKLDYGVYNVGTGKPVSILEVAKVLIQLYGKEMEPKIVNKSRAGDVRHCYADISAIKAKGFMPMVNFVEGMTELMEWVKRTTAIDRVDVAAIELSKRGLIG